MGVGGTTGVNSENIVRGVCGLTHLTSSSSFPHSFSLHLVQAPEGCDRFKVRDGEASGGEAFETDSDEEGSGAGPDEILEPQDLLPP